MLKYKSIFLAGHKGMVGSSILKHLINDFPKIQILYSDKTKLDLRNSSQVENFFKKNKPEAVILAAAKVGGIHANNSYPAEFIYDNIMIASNIIHYSYIYKVKKLIFLGSSCIYPRDSIQPLKERFLLTGILEKTNEPYAIAKIAGIKMCEAYNRQYGTNFIGLMPTNMYGPGDNYHAKNSHVIAALIKKFHEGKTKNLKDVIVWGSGKAKREFMFVDDFAKKSLYFLFNNIVSADNFNINDNPIINIGTGEEVSINELVNLVKTVIGFKGNIIYDQSMPDGTPRKLLDLTIIKSLNFNDDTKLQDGLKKTYKSFLESNI